MARSCLFLLVVASSVLSDAEGEGEEEGGIHIGSKQKGCKSVTHRRNGVSLPSSSKGKSLVVL